MNQTADARDECALAYVHSLHYIYLYILIAFDFLRLLFFPFFHFNSQRPNVLIPGAFIATTTTIFVRPVVVKLEASPK